MNKHCSNAWFQRETMFRLHKKGKGERHSARHFIWQTLYISHALNITLSTPDREFSDDLYISKVSGKQMMYSSVIFFAGIAYSISVRKNDRKVYKFHLQEKKKVCVLIHAITSTLRIMCLGEDRYSEIRSCMGVAAKNQSHGWRTTRKPRTSSLQ